jgi:hypothetical protein
MHYLKKIILCSIAVLALLTTNGCASAGFNTAAPIGLLYNGTATGISANNNVKITKEGRACFLTIFGVAIGSANVDEAMKNAKITQVATVDHSAFVILFLGHVCTLVSGN